MSIENKLLRESKTIAVVGLSGNPMRTSHIVSHYMQEQGYRIIPVNPRETEVMGEQAYPSLEAIGEPIDIVNVFRRSEFVPAIVEAAIRVGAKAIWLQEGIVHEAAEQRARDAGLQVIADRCILKAHRSFLSQTRPR